MRMRYRLLAAPIVAAMGFAGLTAGSTAVAADDTPSEVVVIDGREFGPEDGLVVEEGEADAGGGIAPTATTSFSRGTTFVSSTEQLQLYYIGNGKAYANVYSGKRWIQSSFRYSRGGEYLIGWQRSNATVNSACTWSAGALVAARVNDSLNPSAPQTKFHYGFSSVNTGAC